MKDMPRYAAVDIGSNSVRMLAAEVAPGRPAQVLAAGRQVTRIGESVFRTGRVSPEAMSFLCEQLANMAQTYRKLDVIGARAVATAAVRDSSNQREFIQRASAALGSPVEVISGQEEARLIHLGVQANWPHPKQHIVIIDVGGGSAEVIRSENGRMVEAVSKPIGAVRLTETFLTNDPPTDLDLHRLDEFIYEKIAGSIDRLRPQKADRVVATSASAAAIVCTINRVHRTHRETAERLRVTTAEIRKFYKSISRMSVAERRKVNGIGPRRAEIIVAGTAVFLRILEHLKLPSMYYSIAGVRDGIIADLDARGVGRELSRLNRDQKRTCEQMARRYGVAIGHARKVAQTASTLFDSLQTVHKLPPFFGKMIEAAAYLHDVGHLVSDTSHHKHSHYIIANSDMAGFTDTEREFISVLCRFHRKTMPTARHEVFGPLSSETQRSITLLIPLLRLADNLDRSHQQFVEEITCAERDGQVVVSLHSSHDTDLEQWASERSADLFRQVYGKQLKVVRG
jgi:exopolyphosphatase/guanosine-5'-triphosphate,3'-diphosphate pyrophosphatase